MTIQPGESVRVGRATAGRVRTLRRGAPRRAGGLRSGRVGARPGMARRTHRATLGGAVPAQRRLRQRPRRHRRRAPRELPDRADLTATGRPYAQDSQERPVMHATQRRSIYTRRRTFCADLPLLPVARAAARSGLNLYVTMPEWPRRTGPASRNAAASRGAARAAASSLPRFTATQPSRHNSNPRPGEPVLRRRGSLSHRPHAPSGVCGRCRGRASDRARPRSAQCWAQARQPNHNPVCVVARRSRCAATVPPAAGP